MNPVNYKNCCKFSEPKVGMASYGNAQTPNDYLILAGHFNRTLTLDGAPWIAIYRRVSAKQNI